MFKDFLLKNRKIKSLFIILLFFQYSCFNLIFFYYFIILKKVKEKNRALYDNYKWIRMINDNRSKILSKYHKNK